jgi:hydrogenase-4 component B
MPTTATTFLVGSVAICGLPPLNGFVSEWLIYVGAFTGASHFPTVWAVSSLVTVPALALIGGLAVACFVKAFGVVFLGQPRTAAASNAHEAGLAMRAPMIVGALLCLAIGLWPTGAIRLVTPAATLLGRMPAAPADVVGPLLAITRVAVVLLALIALLALFRHALLRSREVTQTATWGCGYAAPSPRMQYTSTSFAEPLLAPFASVIPSRVSQEGPAGYFPTKAHYEQHIGDMAGERFLIPGARRVIRALSRLRVIQQGRLQLYLVYIAVTLVVLLVWQLVEVGR